MVFSGLETVSTTLGKSGRIEITEVFNAIRLRYKKIKTYPNKIGFKFQSNSSRIIHGFFHKTIFRVLSSKCKQIYPDFPTIYTGSANQNEDIATYKAITRFPS